MGEKKLFCNDVNHHLFHLTAHLLIDNLGCVDGLSHTDHTRIWHGLPCRFRMNFCTLPRSLPPVPMRICCDGQGLPRGQLLTEEHHGQKGGNHRFEKEQIAPPRNVRHSRQTADPQKLSDGGVPQCYGDQVRILAPVNGCLLSHRLARPTKIGMVDTTVATWGTEA